MDHFDVCIVGAGAVGLAIARELCLSGPASLSVLLLERHAGPGQETSSRNSEVIHAGIYYPPGSLKARLCRRGRDLLYDYCRQYDVPHRRCGKHIVASEAELGALEEIEQRARANQVLDLRWLDQNALRQAEPAVSGNCALFSPSTGILDSHSYMLSLLHQAEAAGLLFAPLTNVLSVEPGNAGFQVRTACGEGDQPEYYSFSCSRLINSAGLGAQALARNIQGLEQSLIPPLYYCKGDYFALTGPSPFNSLIYPVPEKDQKGLGIHATLDMGGQVRFGPHAAYVDAIDYSVDEENLEQFCRAIGRYFPGLDHRRLRPDYSGIRPKLRPEGGGTADFLIQGEAKHGMRGLVQLFGIESPGLTASLAIAEEVRLLLSY